MPEYWQKKIPEKRLVKVNDNGGTQAGIKLKIRNDGAWNLGLALATSELELKLIFVNQYDYPLHLIEEISTSIIVFFSVGEPIIIPGNMKASFRPNYIGPRYSKCIGWAYLDIPEGFRYKMPPPSLAHPPDILRDLLNKTPNFFFNAEALELAEDLISRKAVVC